MGTVPRKPLVHFLLTAVLGVIVYCNTFDAPFVFDDEAYILNNPVVTGSGFITDPSRAEDLLLHENVRSTLRSRYLGYLSFAMNHKLHGLDVTGYHAVNLAVHLLNATLLYFLVLLTFRTPCLKDSELTRHSGSVALFSALLFVSHPLQTEAVTYITQRFASLAAFFYLLSLVSYIKSRFSNINSRRLLFYALSLLSALAAMKTKEISFTLPVVLALYEVFFFRGAFLKRVLLLLPLSLTMLTIPLSIMDMERPLGEAFLDATKTELITTRGEYLLTQFRVVLTYVRLLLLPIGQNLDYDYPVFDSFLDPQVFFSIVFLLSAMGLAVFLHHRSRTSDPGLRLISFGILWFFIGLSVESGLIPLADVIFEHRTYLPSAGFLISVSASAFYVVRKSSGMRVLLSAAFVLITIALAVAAYQRNLAWGSERALWGDTVSKSPGKARPHNNLGNAYMSEGLVEQAVWEFQRAVRLDPDFVEAYQSLETAYLLRPEILDAIEETGGAGGYERTTVEVLRRVLEKRPDFAGAHVKLAIAYERLNEIDQAVEHYETALRLKPDYTEAHYNLGLIYHARGLIEKAKEHFLSTLALNPNFAEAHNNLGLIYYAWGDMLKAQEHFRRATKLKPELAQAHFNLGIVYLKTGQRREARREFKATLKIRPDDMEAIGLLERTYY
jgi:tetratricopeptide (TPR) repeat protein